MIFSLLTQPELEEPIDLAPLEAIKPLGAAQGADPLPHRAQLVPALSERGKAPSTPGHTSSEQPHCSAPSCTSGPPNAEGRGTYRIEGRTSIPRRAENTGLNTPRLLLLVLCIHILPEENLEAGRHSCEPGSAQLSQQPRGQRSIHPPPPAQGQRWLLAAPRPCLAGLLPIPPYAPRPGSSEQHPQLPPRAQQMARAPKPALLSAFSILAPSTPYTLFSP